MIEGEGALLSTLTGTQWYTTDNWVEDAVHAEYQPSSNPDVSTIAEYSPIKDNESSTGDTGGFAQLVEGESA